MLKNLFKKPNDTSLEELREEQLDTYRELAKKLPAIEKASNCVHRKVASILYNPLTKQIITTGVNRTPSNDSPCVNSNSCTKHITGKCPIIHSEVNAILSCFGKVKSFDNIILICTYSPCYECSKVIKAVGIKEVYFINKHHRTDWKYLKDNDILTVQL